MLFSWFSKSYKISQIDLILDLCCYINDWEKLFWTTISEHDEILIRARKKQCKSSSNAPFWSGTFESSYVRVGTCATHSLRSFVKSFLNPLLKNACAYV